jgi:hypothetical protein
MTKWQNLTWIVATAAACSTSSSPRANLSGAGGTTGGIVPPIGSGGASPIGIEGGLQPPGGEIAMPRCTSNCKDFPPDPIFDPGVPPNAPDLFGPADRFAAGSLCVLEPQLSTASAPGALFPANWLRPRFRFAGAGDLFEIRVTSPVQANALVAYTTKPSWTMPKEIWTSAALDNAGQSMTITVRAVQMTSPAVPVGVRGDIHIAPVNAGGSMVFWTVASSVVGPDSSKLLGFRVGDEAVIEALAPKKVAFTSILHENGRDLRGEYGGGKAGFSPGEVQCIGCHTSTPDGKAVLFTDDWPWDKPIASVTSDAPGAVPTYVSPGARTLLKMPWLGTQSTSRAHWSPGDRILIASYGQRTKPFDPQNGQNDRIMWIDLETNAPISDEVPPASSNMRDAVAAARNQAIEAARGTAWGVLRMDGETASAVVPNFSHAGDRIAYVSTDKSPDGHPEYGANRADVFIVPYGNRMGGAVAPLAGAADPAFYENYPAFSADDKLVAFSRAPNRQSCPTCADGPYYNRFSDIYVVPSGGGTPVRLSANDPVSCAGDDVGKGLLNSWPKWSPNAVSVGGKKYYFLIFSSARKASVNFEIPRGPYTPGTLDTRSSQLFMAGLVVDEATGELVSYPGVYLWNQSRLVTNGTVTDLSMSNLTPAWDEFQIPPADVPR